MFGTRAAAIIDIAFLVSLLAPVLTWLSMRYARRAKWDVHRRVQVVLLVVAVAAVIGLEVQIRLSGGSGTLLSQSAWGATSLARAFLGVHIVIAVLTYGLWTYLAVASHRRFRAALPGTFSPRHKQLGKVVFAGLCISAVTAAGMYSLAFVL